MVDLLIIAPSVSFSDHVPAGFIFADEVFAEASLRDSISEAQKPNADLDRILNYLVKRFPQRIRVRRITPWSIPGLWVIFKYRLRSFPTVIVNGETILYGEMLNFETLTAHINSHLSQPKTDPTL